MIGAGTLYGALRVFATLRRESEDLMAHYLGRLDAQVPRAGSQPVATPVEHDPAPTSPSGPLARFPLVKNRGLYRATKRALRDASLSTEPIVVVALASKRLRAVQTPEPVRQTLAALLEPLPGHHSMSDLAGNVRRARRLMLCEPAHDSPMRYRQARVDDATVVVDDTFLVFLLVTSPRALGQAAGMVALLLMHWTWSLARSAASPMPTLREVVAGGVCAAAYEELFRPVRQIEALLVTSNSFATEILRFHLLSDRRCAMTTEVLHGVPTADYERYLESLMDLFEPAGGPRRHRTVPQLPDLPLSTRFYGESNPRPGAINAAVNAYMASGSRGGEVSTRIVDAARSMIASAPAGPTLIVAFTGGTSFDRDYLDSPAFRVEAFLIRSAVQAIRDMGRQPVIIYTPHPALSIERFRRAPVLVEQAVIVHPDTVLSWLVADLCLSLHSSGLFEAQFCGAFAFAPMTPSDGMFSAGLLSRIAYPRDSQSLKDALTAFIHRHAVRAPEDIGVRVRARLGLWVNAMTPADDLHDAAVAAGVRL